MPLIVDVATQLFFFVVIGLKNYRQLKKNERILGHEHYSMDVKNAILLSKPSDRLETY